MSDNFDNLIKPKECCGSNIKEYYSAALKNRDKNRYKDVVPYNQYRVILNISNDSKNSKESDYINASHLPGINGNETYISCQAPLPSTILDFYNMILDNNISVIVMLTKLMGKNGEVKAHCYWPKKTYKLYDIEIKLVSTCNIEDIIIIRKLQITRDDEDPKIVHQLHYKGWPDKDKPENDNLFLQLISLTRNLHNDGTKLLAHCSAGIGRAGTFLAIYSYIEYYLSGNPENVFDIVNNFRKQRLGMVQTEGQYNYIFEISKKYLHILGCDINDMNDDDSGDDIDNDYSSSSFDNMSAMNLF